ncbi:MAG: PaaI family thioesterase [Verrucomicrobia bacterium]|nr:PaaI family thioesterase [Verrucomicrobiota bacterium]
MSAILLPYTHGCFVCGADNPHGLRLKFFAHDGEIRAEFHPDARHEGYRGIIHGGVLASALDEVMFWAAAYATRRFHVSVQLDLRYQKKVEVGKNYLLAARLAESQRRLCSTVAELRAADGEVCASATGRFFPMRRDEVPLQHEDFYPDPGALSPAQLFGEL